MSNNKKQNEMETSIICKRNFTTKEYKGRTTRITKGDIGTTVDAYEIKGTQIVEIKMNNGHSFFTPKTLMNKFFQTVELSVIK